MEMEKYPHKQAVEKAEMNMKNIKLFIFFLSEEIKITKLVHFLFD